MRVRPEHWQLLLTICQTNPELVTNKFNGVEGKAKGAALWQSVASKLNSLGYGEKSVEECRKALTDWKSKTKAKAATRNREMQKTGGGSTETIPLSALEEALLAIMGPKTVIGDEDVPELGFAEVAIPNKVIEDLFEIENLPECSKRTHNVEHDYAGEPATKRKIESTSTPQSSRNKRRRPYQAMHLSRELLELNNETRDILNKMNSNLESIAKAINVIANVLENKLR